MIRLKRPFAAAAVFALALALLRVPSAGLAATITQQQADELTASYAYLITDFYKKVDPQIALDGAHAGVIAFLKAQGIKNPALTSLHATADDVANVRELQRESVARSTRTAQVPPCDHLRRSPAIGSVKDKYSTFLDPKAFAELNEGLDGASFGGVGLSYSVDDTTKNIRVENVIIDGPSDRAGIRGDDQITMINGQPVKDIIAGAPVDIQQTRIQKQLRGDPGTRVTLAILRNGAAIAPITVTRETIKAPSVFAKMLPNNVGYAQLSVFGQNTGNELTSALKRLEGQGAKAYVLDLRYNGGGYLNAAIDVSSKFIPSGPIVTVQSRAGRSTEYDAENTAIPARPLVVLVNNFTASASEITAGAIQDSGVGTLIGTKTYSKGVVQTIFPLRDGSAVRSRRRISPNGRDINTVGIQPQIKPRSKGERSVRLSRKTAAPTRTSLLGRIALLPPPAKDPRLSARYVGKRK